MPVVDQSSPVTDVQQAVPVAGEDREAIGKLAIHLAATATADEEEHGEWTWRDIAAEATRYFARLTEHARKADRLGEGVREAAVFLRDRVTELEGDMQEGITADNYYGHVVPALARLDCALDADVLDDPTHTREAEAWQDISSAPKNGTIVDLWKTAPDGLHGRRVPDCRWDSNRSFNGGIGRVALPDAWVHSHGGEVHCDGGELTYWRSVPDAPRAALSAGSAQ